MNEMKDRVAKLRKILKLSQEGLAQRLGISWTTVNRWERGETEPVGLYKKEIESMFREYLTEVDEKEGKHN